MNGRDADAPATGDPGGVGVGGGSGAGAVLECDVLVVGSDAAASTAAVTAAYFGSKIVVAEKAPVFGGTSAWSGGWLWIPHNPLALAAGIDEPRGRGVDDLRSELGPRAGDMRLPAFLANGPEMVRFLEAHGALHWIDGNGVLDFHETAGAATGGRLVCAMPYDARALGAWIDKLRPPLDVVSLWDAGIRP